MYPAELYNLVGQQQAGHICQKCTLYSYRSISLVAPRPRKLCGRALEPIVHSVKGSVPQKAITQIFGRKRCKLFIVSCFLPKMPCFSSTIDQMHNLMALTMSRRTISCAHDTTWLKFYASVRIDLRHFLATLKKCKNAARPVK